VIREQVKFWRFSYEDTAQSLPPCSVELLRARYITHTFCRHTHETYAIGVIEQGAEAFDCRGNHFVAPAGSIALINPGEVHTGHAADQATGWTYRMLYPDVSLLQRAASELGQQQAIPYFSNPVIQDRPLAQRIVKLHVALEGNSRLEQDSRLLWTMAQLIVRHASNRPALAPIGKLSQPLQQVRDYLEAHYAENLSLDQLATVANLSRFYLIRAFRNQVGMPPHSYLNQVRLAQAKRLLAVGQPISDVAQQTGFADQSHLTRQFKRMLGVTPGQFSRSHLT